MIQRGSGSDPTALYAAGSCTHTGAFEGKIGLLPHINTLSLSEKMYYEEDAPRSARSVGYGSPRDDRFYTPRTVARSNSNSNSEEW
eukprot:gene36616-41445_t